MNKVTADDNYKVSAPSAEAGDLPAYVDVDYSHVGKTRYIREDLCSQDKWISVNEKLPITEEGMGYASYMDINLILTDGNIVEVGSFIAGNTMEFWGRFIYGDNSAHDGDKVTHWMPLPSPPKAEE